MSNVFYAYLVGVVITFCFRFHSAYKRRKELKKEIEVFLELVAITGISIFSWFGLFFVVLFYVLNKKED